jgi:hypothetical protein
LSYSGGDKRVKAATDGRLPSASEPTLYSVRKTDPSAPNPTPARVEVTSTTGGPISDIFVPFQEFGRGCAAKELEIRITPAMIEAGESLVWREMSGSIPHPSFSAVDLAKSVFREMSIAARNGDTSQAR